MTEGGHEAVRADEEMAPASDVHRLEEPVRELERLLGRRAPEVEILKGALDRSHTKKAISLSSSAPQDGSR